MSVTNIELLNKIEEWEKELTDNSRHIHFALLEVFIEFEKFLTHAFISYALKEKGKNSFAPELRLQFDDKVHLQGLLQCSKPYIDYIKKVKEVRKFIFKESTCPFHKVFSTADFNTNFLHIKIMRDFIAHQSEESKAKYVKTILNSGRYIKVNTYLNTLSKHENISNYSRYINALKFYSEVICDGRSS